MKNILARGGIEFIAVFLGIGLSFYVDEWRNDREQKELLIKDCNNILTDVNEDLITIDKIISFNKDILKSDKYIIRSLSQIDSVGIDTLVKEINSLTHPTFFGITRSYKLSYSTGRLNLYAEENLVIEISKLYDHYYERLKINSDIYDEIGLNFLDNYVIKNIGHTRLETDYNKNEVLIFLKNKYFLNQLIAFNYRVEIYLDRLNDTKNQLYLVKRLLDKYLFIN